MSEHCVVCGMEIPEGRQVCPICQYKAAQKPRTTMTDGEAVRECQKMLGVVMEYAARQGGLYCWMHERDRRLYNTLQGLCHHHNQIPTLLTMVKALDAAGYRLRVVPK